MEGDKALGLVHSTGADTAELLHVGADTEEETNVDTERSDVSSSYTRLMAGSKNGEGIHTNPRKRR